MKKLGSLLLAFAMVLALAACGGSGTPAPSNSNSNSNSENPATTDAKIETITVKVGNVGKETVGTSLFMHVFADAVEERLPGRFEFKFYHNSELGSEREYGEMVHNGEIEGAVVACSVMNAVVPVPAGNLQDCMFMFGGTDDMYDILNKGYREYLDAEYEAGGLINMGYVFQVIQDFENNIRPVRTPGDLKGLKIRSYEGIGPLAFLEGVGAIPVTLAFSECYSALQQGTIDGLYSSLTAYGTSKMSEVADYHTKASATCTGYGFTFNKAWFDALPADAQTAFREAATVAEDWMRDEFAPNLYDEEMAKIEANGTEIIELTDAEMALFIEAAKEYCWPAIKEAVGEELWAKALEWSGQTE